MGCKDWSSWLGKREIAILVEDDAVLIQVWLGVSMVDTLGIVSKCVIFLQ